MATGTSSACVISTSLSHAPSSSETASTISSWLSALLAAYRTLISTQVTMTKEAAAGYTRVLRKVLNTSDKKLTSEAYAFEGEDALDVELDDMDDVDEAAIDGADEPEGDTDDIGLVKEETAQYALTYSGTLPGPTVRESVEISRIIRCMSMVSGNRSQIAAGLPAFTSCFSFPFSIRLLLHKASKFPAIFKNIAVNSRDAWFYPWNLIHLYRLIKIILNYEVQMRRMRMGI